MDLQHYWVKFSYNGGFGQHAESDEFICCVPRDVRNQIAELRKKYTSLKIEMIVKL